MKKTIIFFLSLMFFLTLTHAQKKENRYKLAVSWSPMLYSDVVNENSTLSQFSLLGASFSGEYSFSPRLSIIAGFQYNTWTDPESNLIPDEPNTGDYYSVTIDRISSFPLGVNYILTNPVNRFILYANAGLKYTREFQSRSYSPDDDGLIGGGYGPKNILMANFGFGTSYNSGNRLAPYAIINYGSSIAGDNSGVSTLSTELGLKISF